MGTQQVVAFPLQKTLLYVLIMGIRKVGAVPQQRQLSTGGGTQPTAASGWGSASQTEDVALRAHNGHQKGRSSTTAETTVHRRGNATYCCVWLGKCQSDRRRCSSCS